MGGVLISRLALFLVIGAILGWMGPFGTYDQLGPRRFLYWMIAVPVIGFCVRFALRIVAGHGRAGDWPLPARVAAGAALAGFPGSFVALLLHGTMIGALHVDAWGLVEVYATVTLVIALLAYPLSLLMNPAPSPEAPVVVEEAAAVPSFLKRIPPRLGTELLWLSAEDHYIRVTTALGADLVLCRLSDAVAELGAQAGQRVHRSHWVAQGAVASVERRDGKTALRLVNGESVPVSQSYVPTLKAAGWL